jgi:hypothetical protein
VRQYLAELEQQNPTEKPAHQQRQVSTTDPDATYRSFRSKGSLGDSASVQAIK